MMVIGWSSRVGWSGVGHTWGGLLGDMLALAPPRPPISKAAPTQARLPSYRHGRHLCTPPIGDTCVPLPTRESRVW